MKQILLLSLLVGQFNLFATIKHKDSSHRNIILEIGNTYTDMYGNDNDFYQKSRHKVNFISITSSFYEPYHLSVQYFYVSMSTKYFRDNYSTNNMTPGKTLGYGFSCIRINAGKKFQLKRILISPLFSINRRFGFGEEIYLGGHSMARPHYFTSSSAYRSFGTGIGCNISYVFKNRYSLGTEANLSYNFEKVNPFPSVNFNPDELGVKPSRLFSTIHFKLGYLLF